MFRLLILGLILAGVSAAPDPADQTTNGPASTPASPDPRAADKLPIDERPPLWQVYYDRGVRAMREKDYRSAMRHFERTLAEMNSQPGPRDPQLWIDVETLAGDATLRFADASGNADMRFIYFPQAVRHFASARNRTAGLHGDTGLAYAEATDRLADAKAANAELTDDKLARYLNPLNAGADDNHAIIDLYLLTLTIREQQLGETHSETMTYRRKVLRQLRKWIRTANALRRKETDIKILYQYDPIIERFKTLADELTQRDRDLKRPDDASTNGD